MLLIIPSIPIVHGVCGAQIAALAHELHHADGEIYSQNPIDRARLLRKENSKAIQLSFFDREPWCAQSLALITEIREAVDIPLGVSLTEMPDTDEDIDKLFQAGVYRVFLPFGASEDRLFNYCNQFTCRKIIPTVDMRFDFEHKLQEYRSNGIDRVAIDISPRDTLETGVIDWTKLASIAEYAKKAGVRLTALHGVRGYPELKKLQELSPALDSLVLCRALNENRFPCQLIWREVEATAALEHHPSSNLWSNPLADRPHI